MGPFTNRGGGGCSIASATHLTPTQGRAYVLADNKLALNAGWDLEMLSLEIGELGEAGFSNSFCSSQVKLIMPALVFSLAGTDRRALK